MELQNRTLFWNRVKIPEGPIPEGPISNEETSKATKTQTQRRKYRMKMEAVWSNVNLSQGMPESANNRPTLGERQETNSCSESP